MKPKAKVAPKVEPVVEPKADKSWITEASLLVPLAIFIAYAWALSLVAGFYDYFSVPGDFISFNSIFVLNISRPFYILLAFVLSIIYITRLVARFVEDVSIDNPGRRLFLSMLVASLPMLILTYQNYERNKLLSSITGALYIIFLAVVFIFRKKLTAQHKRIQARRQARGLSIVRYWNDLVILGILIAVGVVSPSLFYLGKYGAANKKDFYVIKQSLEGRGDSEVVLLGNYGDYLVTVPFDRTSKKFKSKFVLLKMSDSKTPLSISLEKEVGPLQPEEIKPPEVKSLPQTKE
jgi:hypothetical protein